MNRILIESIVSMPFAENTYVVWREGDPACLVVDPGLEPNLIFDFLDDHKLIPAAILNTHGHADHIAGNRAMKDRYPEAPLVIGVNDAPLLADPVANVSRSFGFDIISPPADRLLQDGERELFAGIPFTIFEIPGHSPGHVVFWQKDSKIVIGGDVLFREGIGRTDFPGGSFATLARGIRTKLYTLPDETTVYPGHGPETTIGHEKANNPFVDAE
jgi:hydroxyacylglutathione hydrolase